MSAHRLHAHYLAKGGSLKSMLAELYGRSTGCAMGKGRLATFSWLRVWLLCSSSYCWQHYSNCRRVAWASKLKKSKNIVTVFGDGATEEGVLFESLNFSCLKNVPILFVCENNFYSVYSPLKVRQSPNRNISSIAESHGLKTFTGDGNDLHQVSKITNDAIKYMQQNNAPAFIEFETFRWLEHVGPNWDDDIGYRDDGELDHWLKRDPLENYKNFIMEKGIVNEDQILEKKDNIRAEIEEAFKYAKNSPFPDIEVMDQHIYKD